MDGRGLHTMMVKIGVPVMATLLLLTASSFSMTPDDCACACLRAFFGSSYFLMMCVVSQTNLGCLLARKAVRARTPAARRYYAVGAVACFLELPLKLYMILVLVSSSSFSLMNLHSSFLFCQCPAAVEDAV